MTYPPEVIERAARILCEKRRIKPSARFGAAYALIIRDHLAFRADIESALQQAQGEMK